MRRLYAAALLAVYALCIVHYRHDVADAVSWTARSFAAGGPRAADAALRTLLELAVFGVTMALVPWRPRPRQDAVLLLAGAFLGWLAEVWGTRTGLWSYYNGQRPPALIFVVWSVGAVVLARAGELARAMLPVLGRRPLAAFVYWSAAAGFAAAWLLFLGPRTAWPSSLAVGAALSAAFLLKPEPERDAPLLAAAPLLVLMVDYVGTRGLCWTYAPRGPYDPFWTGVFFGAFFDSAVVLAAWRLAMKG